MGGGEGKGLDPGIFCRNRCSFPSFNPDFFPGFFWGFWVFFFLCFPGKSSDPLRRIARNSKGMELGADWERLRPWIWENPGWDLGSRLEFGMEESGMESGMESGIWDGRIWDGIQDPGWNLGWKNPGWNLGSRPEFGRIWAGIWNLGWKNPGWNSGSRPDFGLEESRECGADPTLRNPQNPSGLRQFPAALLGRSRGSGFLKNLGKSQERTSLTPKFHLLFQEELIPAEIPEFGAVSPPPAEKSAGIFPGDPKKFPAPTLVGLPPPLFPANPDPSSEFRAGNGQNSAGAGSRTSGRAGHGSRSEFPEFGTGIESRTLALPPNLFPVFFFSFGVFFFMEATLEFLECRAVGEGGGGGRKSGIPGNFGVGFSSWKTPG
ncbi:uncharacterized protein LOC116435836 isoform X6 [Corvus moneduloides]|uniref:uncharacterized protein LOC116435836 isoform X6 n=1 Tax=Corvus moneduloides TaxID=1196302 RepID=UPI0013620BFA|nr:uncharacterized protein LOC116435836 isoform X6 [Corvus moneduloides]